MLKLEFQLSIFELVKKAFKVTLQHDFQTSLFADFISKLYLYTEKSCLAYFSSIC